MATQLNIKDAGIVVELRAWAQQDGQSITATMRGVMERERRRREGDKSARLAGMMEWADKVYAALPDDVWGMASEEIMDPIYDNNEPDGFAPCRSIVP